jgi:phosphohistidine phosphatase
MRIYLLRHATAEERGAAEDSKRALVKKGVLQCRKVAALLARARVLPDIVLASPTRRTEETARQVERGLGRELALVLDDRLAPGEGTDGAVSMLLSLPEKEDRVLVVGHEPGLSLLAARLLGARSLDIDLRKGGLVEIEIVSKKPLRARLLGLLRPGYL